ncbi:hypothetical protein D3C80_639740 [compost metagenome]
MILPFDLIRSMNTLFPKLSRYSSVSFTVLLFLNHSFSTVNALKITLFKAERRLGSLSETDCPNFASSSLHS